jgi:hypothetical protein
MKSKALLFPALLISFAVATAPAAAQPCGNPEQVTLFGGQTIDTGTVTVSNFNLGSITVTYATNDPWVITAVHLAVADSLAGIPQNGNHNPLPGHFPINTTYNPPVTTVTFTIPVDNLVPGETIFVGAQAEVQTSGGQSGGSQTAWGFGPRFGGHNWATYIEYTVQACRLPE